MNASSNFPTVTFFIVFKMCRHRVNAVLDGIRLQSVYYFVFVAIEQINPSLFTVCYVRVFMKNARIWGILGLVKARLPSVNYHGTASQTCENTVKKYVKDFLYQNKQFLKYSRYWRFLIFGDLRAEFLVSSFL